MKNKYVIFLFILFIGGYILRTLYLPQKSLTFGYDQARDAFLSLEIAKGDFKVLGPPASTPGLFHGVFYYYVLAPIYGFSNGNPIVAAYWIAFLNMMAIFIVYILTFLLSRKHTTSLLASLFFAVSFESSQYALWLSNPTLGVWTVPAIYLGLWIWLKERKYYGAIIAGVALGLSMQAEIFLIYHIVPTLFWFWRCRKDLTIKLFGLFSFSFLIAISTMILAEIKFGFKGLNGAIHLLTTSDSIVKSQHFGDFLLLYLSQLGTTLSNNLFPLNLGYGGMLGLIFLFLLLRKKQDKYLFIASYVLAHLSVVTVGGTSTPFLLVGIGSGIAIMAALIIEPIYRQNKLPAIFLTIIIVISNMTMIVKENKKGQTIFSIQKGMLLSKQLEVLDYTYTSSNSEKFSINTLTSPLWINNVWSYLYHWYGLPKYGYLPEWHGKDQIGLLSDNLVDTSMDTKIYYLIIQPLQGIPIRYLDETVNDENAISQQEEDKQIGEFQIQKRRPLEKKRTP